MIDQTWPFCSGEEGGFQRSLLCLSNEREAKLAASFDPCGIKMVLLMAVKRSGLSVSSRLSDMLLGKIYSPPPWSVRGGSVHGRARCSDSLSTPPVR